MQLCEKLIIKSFKKLSIMKKTILAFAGFILSAAAFSQVSLGI